ncbi:MAG: CCA tRNA nucleotidyltransferase [Alphaproteobacteria bacterium]|jgi:poly(A) polymerase|nr:CCA tRNA nucleotidyltransferase [Alphaproteobacteria bacterium]
MSDAPVDMVKLSEALAGPAATAVVDALAADGAEVRFVGGCVRDCLLVRAVDDVDLATPDRPESVMALLERAGIKAVPTGLKHGTVTAVLQGKSFEITTLRVDVETDGRHAEVVFTNDWRADAARRDFTINAMSLTVDGALFDYFGGREDLAAGLVRFVGEADQRIAEDYLRVMRFFRFLARFGRGEPDAEAVAACRGVAGRLGQLSIERVQVELLKLLAAPNPVPTLVLMEATGILEAVLPEAGPSGVLMVLAGIDDRDPLRRLAALAPNGGKALAQRLKLSNAMADRFGLLAPPVVAMDAAMTREEQRRILYRHGDGIFRDLVLLAWAGDDEARADHWRAMLETANAWDNPALPIRGNDVVEAGLAPGPEVGRVIAEIETWWSARDFQPDRAACLAVMTDVIARQV